MLIEGMNPKQKAFADFYLTNKHNAVKAYEDAGYNPKNAHVSAYRLLENVSIKAYINKHKKDTAESVGITRESLLKELDEVKVLANNSGQFPAVIKAIEVQAKMLGLNEAKKIELSGALDVKIARNFGERFVS